jgi:epoxide hydrolase-like predicted phosphatase
MIKAIIFDFGRVISAQKPPSLFSAYEKDLSIPPGTINPVMFGSKAWRKLLVGRITTDEYWQAIAPQLNLSSAAAISSFRKRYRQDEAVNEGVVQIVCQLRGQYKLGVLSNCPPGLADWLREWEILHLFDAVLCSGDEGLVKPDPAFFELVFDRLRVAPDEAVFIDDTSGHVLAAQRVGMRGVLFTTSEQLKIDLARLLGSGAL